MLNLRKFALSLSLGIIFISMSCFTVFATPNSSIPKEVLELAQEKVQADKVEMPKTKAWVVDLKGNTNEVKPLYLNEQNSSKTSILRVPSDGLTYTFDKYCTQNPGTNWHYKLAGVYRTYNAFNTIHTVQYKQSSYTNIKWTVSGSISAKTTIGNSFLGEVEAEVAGNLERSKSFYAGREYGDSYPIPGKTVAYLANYVVGTSDYGSLRYKRYTPAGSFLGYYYESAGGTAVNTAYANVELLDYDPT